MRIEAKNFKLRSDLENEVRNKIGLTTDPKPKHTIVGTKEELARLHLSGRTIFWGILCEVIDSKPEIKVAGKPERGPVFESGINLPEEKKGKKKKLTGKNKK
jgi:hypothetical protein